jgi:hypothetical protein
MKNKSLRHAITSLISVIVSTLRGIEYITYGDNDIVIQKIIKILKEQENGNVTQRFCLAILQKCSVKDSLIPVYIENDFATAMLANMIHSRSCQLNL